jgi:hypothetical protein
VIGLVAVGDPVKVRDGRVVTVTKVLVSRRTGEFAIQDPDGVIHLLEDCQPVPLREAKPPTDPPPRDPGNTSLAWDDPRLSHKHRLKGSGIPWAKPLSDGIPPWRWDGYWSDDDREDGGSRIPHGE